MLVLGTNFILVELAILFTSLAFVGIVCFSSLEFDLFYVIFQCMQQYGCCLLSCMHVILLL